MDALSRDIFHEEAFLGESAQKVIKTIKASLKRAEALGLKVLSFLSDHAYSYKARSVWEYLKGEGIYRVFSPPYYPQGKAALERYFRTLKEAISSRWQAFLYLIKGIFLRLRQRIAVVSLSLIITGFNHRYGRTPNPGIDGKSPRDRLKKEVSPQYEEALKKVFEEEERKSQLKVELITRVYEEFNFGLDRGKVKRHLIRYQKQSIEKAAEVLRTRLVIGEIPPIDRWRYFATVVYNTEKKRKEEELLQAKEVISQEREREKEREERERML